MICQTCGEYNYKCVCRTLQESLKDPKWVVENFPDLEKRPQFCWHHDFWDGPLSGVCLLDGKEHWFKMLCQFPYEGEEEWEPGEKEIFLARVFGVFELHKEQFAVMKQIHDRFCDYVGTHTNYDETNRRTPGLAPRIRSDGDMFYKWEEKPEFPNLNNNKIVAWWCDDQLSFDDILLGIKKRD